MATSVCGCCCRWQPIELEDAASARAVAAGAAAVPPAPSRREQKRARAKAEAEVRQKELARLKDSAPASAAEFEQLVLASPGSSYVWIQYMAWLLSVAEVAQAREVAERALERIDMQCDPSAT
jgi:rRNA biogenesis protein RRP5